MKGAMKPGSLPDVYEAIVERADAGCACAAAVVLRAEGSTPRKAGARMLVDANGSALGTIGGGPVEAEAQRLAVEAVRTGRPVVFDFAMEGAGDTGAAVCGGAMRVLVDPMAVRCRDAFAAAVAARELRKGGVLLTSIIGSEDLDISVRFLPEEVAAADLPFPGIQAVREALERESAGLFVSETEGIRRQAFVEPVAAKPLLVIVGGGHVGQAVAVQASLVGFDVLVIDDRAEYTAAERYPQGVATRCGPVAAEIARLPVADQTYFVIVTRGHRQDGEALAACLARPAAYVGMIGSRRKVALMRERFLESGQATAEQLAAVYAPIGLDIAAETVPEIAASIVAQLIAVRRRGEAPRIDDRCSR